jgi:rhodanese-related sulfurtransferase
MGWLLARFELESAPRRAALSPPAESRTKAGELAQQLAQDEKIPYISVGELLELFHSRVNAGVTYVIDVRSVKEYEAGHIPASLPVPGGQAVQRTDDFIAVRNARLIFISSESARAVMAAYWYRQMGFRDVSVLQGGLRAWVENGQPLAFGGPPSEPLELETAKKNARFVGPTELAVKLQKSSLWIVDVGTSVDFEAAHVPGAHWISRGWIELKLPERFPDRDRAIVVTCPDGRHSVLASRALSGLGYTDVAVLEGGVRAWTAAGYPTEIGLDLCLAEPKDVVFSPSIRGSKEDMKRYLEWEMKLER